jgi:hypothetical protein
MTEQEHINIGLARWRGQGLLDSHLHARIIANAWHGGQSSDLYALTSSGAIRDTCAEEIKRALDVDQNHEDADELRALLSYVEHCGPRPPQAGWSGLVW